MTSISGMNIVFKDGFIREKNWVIIISELTALADEEVQYTRVFTLRNGVWRQFDLPDIAVRSVCGTSSPTISTYYMGRDGQIRIKTDKGWHEERLPDAGCEKQQCGYVNVMRRIGNDLYVCGFAGQIYRRERSGWVHWDRGVLDAKGPPWIDLHGIDGNSEQDIYTVGKKGAIFHFDGKDWVRLDPPTSETLEWVKYVTPSQVYLCGKHGTFLRGSHAGWDDLSLTKHKVHFWCVEVFKESVYLAASEGLYVFDGRAVKPCDTGLNQQIDGNRLQARDGVLWSFGSKRLCYFDGRKWTIAEPPDGLITAPIHSSALR